MLKQLARSGVVAAVAVAMFVPQTAEAAAAPTPKGTLIPATTFGIHQNSLIGGPAIAIKAGDVRLWDTGVTWGELQPTPAEPNWAPLDQAVATARQRGAQVLYVFGRTPAWAAIRPNSPTRFYPTGSNSVPKDAALQSFARKVAQRYKGKIAAYEVWNEPNIGEFFDGTPADAFRMTKIIRAAVKTYSPRSLVTSPGFTLRRSAQLTWMSKYYGTGAGRYVDVANVHLYPQGHEAPQSVRVRLALVRRNLAAHKVSKPIWNTEMNYGLMGTGAETSYRLSNAAAAAWLSRTYLDAVAYGIARTHWYSVDLRQQFSVFTVHADGRTLTPAGTAYNVTYGWLVGNRRVSFTRDRAGTSTLVLYHGRNARAKNVMSVIKWRDSGAAAAKTPAGAYQKMGLNGKPVRVRPGAYWRVSSIPTRVMYVS